MKIDKTIDCEFLRGIFYQGPLKLYELQVRIILIEMLGCSSIGIFVSNTLLEINKIPRNSSGYASSFYQITSLKNQKQCSVWHLNAKGEPDRLVAVIEDIKLCKI